jgi:PAS domain S-box-containing protein
LNAGFDDVIHLPIEEDNLLRKLEALLRLRRHTEAILEESTERFRATFDLAPVGIVYTDTEGRLLLANRHFCDMLGYSKQELSAFTMRQLVYPEDFDHIRLNIVSLLAGREVAGRQFDSRFSRKDGTVIWTTAAVTLTCDTDGKAKSVVGIVQDVTPRKRLETALRESERFARSIIDVLSQHISVPDEGSMGLDPNQASSAEEFPLTGRQREVLKNIALGFSTKQIAQRLGISPKTVDAHRAQLMERLDIHDIPGLVRYAIRIGMVSVDQ